MTKQTKKYKSKYIFSSILSWLFCFGTTAFLIIFMLAGKKYGTPMRELVGSVVYTFIVTNIPLILLALLVKDKIKPVCWMLNVIMANMVFGGAAIYVVFALWCCDNYILAFLKDLYKDKYRINKEIDNREKI